MIIFERLLQRQVKMAIVFIRYDYRKIPAPASEITSQKNEQNRYWRAFQHILTLLSKPILI